MYDDDLTPLHELASSHLDADNSPEERAHVAATPELQSLVASFEDVRARLADVPPAPAAARDAAFAAALAAFDELQADGAGEAAPRPSAPVVSLDSRRRWPQRMMGIAAAVAAVGVIGVGLTQMGGSDDKSSSADTAAKSELDARVESAQDSTGDAPMSTIGTISGGGASVATVINSLEELAALPAPADIMSPTGGEDPSVAPDDTQASAETSMAAPETIGQSERDSTYSYFPSALPAAGCLTDSQVYLADVIFQGEIGVAARDMVTGVTNVYANDCSVIASVAP